MKDVIIPNPKNDTLLEQFVSLYLALRNTQKNEKLKFNLNNIRFAYPALILPLSAYIKHSGSEYGNIGFCGAGSYLKAIEFPDGIESLPEFNRFSSGEKNYIPISVLLKNDPIKRDKLIDLFSSLIVKILGSNKGVLNAICYPISELTTNIFDHSKADQGYIFGQYYPNFKYLDICIVDSGRGFKKAYYDEKSLDISDEIAIEEVMKGNSTKLKLNNERGFGVHTSKMAICEGLKGEFIMISGSAAIYSNCKKDRLISLKDFNWQGVIIAFRIPRPEGDVDITPYLEG